MRFRTLDRLPDAEAAEPPTVGAAGVAEPPSELHPATISPITISPVTVGPATTGPPVAHACWPAARVLLQTAVHLVRQRRVPPMRLPAEPAGRPDCGVDPPNSA